MSRFTYKNNKYSQLKLVFGLGDLSKFECALKTFPLPLQHYLAKIYFF